MLTSVTPWKALLIGAGLIAVSVKFWVFTLGAIGVIGLAGLPRATNIAIYVVFVLLAVSPHVVIVGVIVGMPGRSTALLDRALRWLQGHNRIIMIALGLVFGVWFLIKALVGFGLF
jgi:Sap, sulfolipid-1-addressing protein